MRIYFHLKDSGQVIPDQEGVDAPGPEEAHDQALRVIDELRKTDTRYWSGWTLVAADETGDVLFTVDLESLV